MCRWRCATRASQKLLASLSIKSHLTADSALLLEPPPETGTDPSHPVLLIPRYGYPDITDGLVRVGRALRAKGIACRRHERAS